MVRVARSSVGACGAFDRSRCRRQAASRILSWLGTVGRARPHCYAASRLRSCVGCLQKIRVRSSVGRARPHCYAASRLRGCIGVLQTFGSSGAKKVFRGTDRPLTQAVLTADEGVRLCHSICGIVSVRAKHWQALVPEPLLFRSAAQRWLRLCRRCSEAEPPRIEAPERR